MGLVLLIACLNLANLMLARAAARQKEMAVRVALGATRARIVRQIVSESLLLSLAGGFAGLMFSWWASQTLFASGQYFHLPLNLDFGLKPAELGYAFALSLLAGLATGAIPARQLLQSNISLRPAKTGMREALVVCQVTLSLVLLIGAGLFIKTLKAAAAEDLTRDPASILLVKTELATHGYSDSRGLQFYSRLMPLITAIPGVRSAGLGWIIPLSGMRGATDVVIDRGGDLLEKANLNLNVVSPGYFETVGLSLVRGRDFSVGDRQPGPGVVIVNEEMARRFWPGEDPIGKRLTWVHEGGMAEVVGVVRDGKYRNFRSAYEPCLYASVFQQYRSEMHLEIRTEGSPLTLLPEVRGVIRDLDPELPMTGIQTMESFLDNALSQERMVAALLSGMGGLALLISMIGIYGVIAFSVRRRAREIAIRMAVGARAEVVLRMVLRRAIVLTIAGLAGGVAVGLALTRMVSGPESQPHRSYGRAPIGIESGLSRRQASLQRRPTSPRRSGERSRAGFSRPWDFSPILRAP